MRVLVIGEAASAAQELAARLVEARLPTRLVPARLSPETLAELAAGADAVLLDGDDASGPALLHRLRPAIPQTPLIVLLRPGQAAAERDAFLHGADAVLSARLPVPTLLARIDAIRRRAPTRREAELRCGNVTLDPASGTLCVGGAAIEVTRCEFDLLELLMGARGAVLDKARLAAALLNDDSEAGEGVLRVFVCRLRRKLASRGADDIIQTVWGVGYRLQPPGSALPGRA